MKKMLILMIPIIVGIAGLVLKQAQNTDQKLSHLTIENIEALTMPIELPGIIITCSSGYEGQCFAQGTRLVMCGEYMYYDCEFVGNQNFSCYSPC